MNERQEGEHGRDERRMLWKVQLGCRTVEVANRRLRSGDGSSDAVARLSPFDTR